MRPFYVKKSIKNTLSIKTGNLFHHLWKNLNNDQFKQSVDLIRKRLKKNKFSELQFKNKIVLDVGCGSGRFCVLASSLQAKKVYGIDSSKINIDYNKKKFKKFTNIKFLFGDNTNLKIKRNFSDITISQGVIHHTTDMFKSLNELIRVTKKRGKILLLVYGEHGMRWSLIKKLRPISNIIGKKEMIKIMKKNNFPANNIKHFIDDLFVPIQVQTGINHLTKYLKEKKLKVKIWNKNNTLDHEQNIEKYLEEFKKLKKIFNSLENKTLKVLSLKTINSYIDEINIIKKSKMNSKEKRFLIIGEGNHRIEITK
ncbi:class I SAM-dependent methyltransferase [Candidatus Pelagibacter sp.]|nr:class I SAM-dependent methyltransferase [Candidatus Pelagibacter sp.]